jgi:hypothetical protein
MLSSKRGKSMPAALSEEICRKIAVQALLS